MSKMISRNKFIKRYPYAFHLVEVVDLISSWPIKRVMKTPLNHTFQFKVGDKWDVLIVPSQNPRQLNNRNHAFPFPLWQWDIHEGEKYTTAPAMRENSRLIVERAKVDLSKLGEEWKDLETITLEDREAGVSLRVACCFGGVRQEQIFHIPHALVSIPLIKIMASLAMDIITRETLRSALGVLTPSYTSVPPEEEESEDEEESLDMDSDEGWGEDDWDEEDDEDYEAEEFEDEEEEEHQDDGFVVEPPEEMSVESQDAMVDLLLGSIGRDCTTSPDWFRNNSYAIKSHQPFNLSHIAAMWNRSEGQYSTVHFDFDEGTTRYTFYKEATGEDEPDVLVAQYDHHKKGVRIDSRVEDHETALRRLREAPYKLLETLQASSPGFMGAVTQVDGRGVRFVVSESTANLIDWWLDHPAHDFLGGQDHIPEHLLPPRIQYDSKTHEITYSGIGSSVSSRRYKDDAGVRAQLQKQIRFSLRRLFVFYPHIGAELLKAYFPDENLSHEDLIEAASKEDPRFMVAQDLHGEGSQYAILENYRQAKFKHLRKLIARGITPGAPPED